MKKQKTGMYLDVDEELKRNYMASLKLQNKTIQQDITSHMRQVVMQSAGTRAEYYQQLKKELEL